MKLYALKYKASLNLFTKNLKDLDIYKNNRITSIVKLKATENENGKYHCFENDNILIIDCVTHSFEEKTKNLIGRIYNINLEEI